VDVCSPSGFRTCSFCTVFASYHVSEARCSSGHDLNAFPVVLVEDTVKTTTTVPLDPTLKKATAIAAGPAANTMSMLQISSVSNTPPTMTKSSGKRRVDNRAPGAPDNHPHNADFDLCKGEASDCAVPSRRWFPPRSWHEKHVLHRTAAEQAGLYYD
jgi:hypothetical protein